MATRSTIGIKNSTGYTWIYCHWDGYLERNGAILQGHYTTEAQVTALIGLGDISTLGETLNSTVAYHRDKGDAWDNVKPKGSPGKGYQEDFPYNYVWEDGRWTVNGKDLETALTATKKTA